MPLTPDSRQAIADILEIVGRDGLPSPRDLDVALDAIEGSIEMMFESIEPVTIIDDTLDTEGLVKFYSDS